VDEQELSEEIGRKAVKNTRKAWSSENIKAGTGVIEA